MSLKVYNTITGQKECFQPLDPSNVKMYVCGITPYDESHLGHGRAYVTFDVVRRYLEYSGYKVTYIQNITDIDDKLIKKSQESGDTVAVIANRYIDSYKRAMKELNVLEPTKYVKATEHIKEMIDWIKQLEEKGFAYSLDGDVYFEVAKFKDYAKLSHRKLDDMLSGARVAVDERKRSPLDFALWKAAKEGEPSWDSPWGKGRPGWHIECSAMSTKYLGEQFDIHGGGRDLIFPHHENEIAQTEAVTCKPWVKYWLHNGFVNINKQKMSKSLGNFFTLRDIFKKFDPMVVRFFLLQTHYRSPIDFSDALLRQAGEALSTLKKALADYEFLRTHPPTPSLENRGGASEREFRLYKDEFKAAMDDDFNTAGAVAVIFSLVHLINKQIKEGEYDSRVKDLLIELCEILGLRVTSNENVAADLPAGKAGLALPTKEIEKLIADREAARKNKDFAKADQIRDQLKSMDVVIEDTPQGTRWTVDKFN